MAAIVLVFPADQYMRMLMIWRLAGHARDNDQHRTFVANYFDGGKCPVLWRAIHAGNGGRCTVLALVAKANGPVCWLLNDTNMRTNTRRLDGRRRLYVGWHYGQRVGRV